MRKGKMTISELKIKINAPYGKILDIRIENMENDHGKMLLSLEALEETAKEQLLQLEGSLVSVFIREEKPLFCGQCANVMLYEQGGYKTFGLEVYANTYRLDMEKHTKTFQSPSKTLQDIFQEILAAYPADIHMQKNPGISTVVYQQDETDWAFIKRIANQYGMQVYGDTRTAQIVIAVGTLQMQKHPMAVLKRKLGESKSIEDQRQIKMNLDPLAASYQFESVEYLCESLPAIPGDAIERETIRKNTLLNQGGILENRVLVGKTADIMVPYEKSHGSNFVSNILTGTVISVEGNQIQVQFDADAKDMAGNCVDVPYESPISNSFYCMPDEKDKVFIYYENNGKIICLGSKRTNTDGPDYNVPEEKVLTNYDKMIRFTASAMKITDTRKKHDEEDDTEISIIMDDEEGITITSGGDVTIETTEESGMHLKTMSSILALANKWQVGNNKFVESQTAGFEKYQADGGDKGLSGWEQRKRASSTEWSRFGRDFQQNFSSTVDGLILKDLFNTVTGKNKSNGEDKEEDKKEEDSQPEAEQFDTGVITIYGLNLLTFQVKDSFLILDSDIYINAPAFRWLGYTKGTHEIVEEEYQDFWGMAMDGLQLALDICGFIPGIGAFFDLGNAVISLARGDYCGGLISLVSAIPFLGDACAAAKMGVKAYKAAERTKKALTTPQKIWFAVKFLYKGSQFFNQGIGVYGKINNLIEEGFDWTNPNDYSKLISIVRGIGDMLKTAKEVKDIGKTLKEGKVDTGLKKQTDDQDGGNAKKTGDGPDDGNTKKTGDGSDGGNPKKKSDGPDNPKKKCDTTDDPINVITGSLLAEYVDLSLEDVLDSFLFKRHYESAFQNKGGILGDKWRCEIESSIWATENQAVIQMPDLHIEKFYKEDGKWFNQRINDYSLLLCENQDGFQLKLQENNNTYEYDQNGNLTAITDMHGNSTRIYYHGTRPEKLETASGQWISFRYENGLLSALEDNLGRIVRYTYQGQYLHTVTMPNGGRMYYQYTKEGFLSSITDLNGRCYAKNFYDRKGRVIRQELAGGEEYVAFYDEANKQNTFLTTSNGENLIYTYGRQKLATEIRYPDGTTTNRDYDEGKNVIYEKDRLGREIFRKYNREGMLVEEHMPDGLETYYSYNDKNLPVKVWDNTGREINNEYDQSGNLLINRKQIDASSQQVTQFTYDDKGRILTVTDANGNQESYSYDLPFSEPTRYVTATGAVILYNYDEGGRLIEVKDEYGTTSYGYNSLANQTICRDAEGNVTRYFYDNMANITKVIAPNQYDASIDDGNGTVYEYDVWTHVSRVTNPDGGIYSYENDFRGNVRKELNPNETQKEDAKGTYYEYDNNYNRIKTIYPDGSILREKYDVCGNILKRILPEAYDSAKDDGEGYTYVYDSCNRLTEIRDPFGTVERRYVYDFCGNVIKDISAKGYMMGETDEDRIGTLYQYDLRGNVTAIRTPMEIKAQDGKQSVQYRLTTYRYDFVGNCIEEKRYLDYQTGESASGRVNTIHYTYDNGDRLVRVSDSTGAHMEYEYNKRNQKIREKRKISKDVWQETYYEYSPAGNLICTARKLGEQNGQNQYAITRFTYDGNGNIICIKTPEGNEILREYDCCDRLTAETHKEKNGNIHHTITFAYDKMDNLIEVKNQDGYKLHYEYDVMNRLIKTIDGDERVQFNRYDGNGNLICRINPQEYAEKGEKAKGYRYAYDIMGRNTSIDTPLGTRLRSLSYNQFGEIEREGDGLGGICSKYDFAGRRIHILTDGGRTQEYEYDAVGNIVGLKDGNGNRTGYKTDMWGRITRTVLADGTEEAYTYDAAGNITSATDGNGNTVYYDYNADNKLSKRVDAAGAEEIFCYDKEGRLCEHLDRDGRKNIYRYNMYGSLTMHEAAGTDLKDVWEYDRMGRLKSAIGGGMRYEYNYYENGLLKEKKASGRTLLSYTYDLDGNKVGMRDLTGKETGYSYDAAGQLTGVHENGRILAGYRYHEDGRVSMLTIGKSLKTEYSYDMDRNLEGIRTWDESKLLVDNHYCYDENANRISKETMEGLTRYSYDANNRLVEVQYPDIMGSAGNGAGSHFERLSYDKAGNRIQRITESIKEEYHYDNCNRLVRLTRSSYKGADPQAAQKTIHYKYDKQGNLLSDGSNTYSYDGFSRLSRAEMSNGKVQVNRYDAEGLRHEMEENGELVKFLFSGDKVVAEEESNGNVIRYVRGLGIISSDSESARTYYHYVSDEQGSITHVLKGEDKEEAEEIDRTAFVGVEEAGSRVLNYYEYDAFGNATVVRETVKNRFRYDGEQYDAVMGQYYLRARYYNPVIGRFTQEDTYYGDGLNLYAYC
ncbi:MAG: DUF6531 domain-containing protein, partial [Roseburia sp.]|nr:DUF6531 domain-containing protein [Roseburia sp.]MCM1278663.1 DUF6531 domain-containing protein [Robinsoniella sp.]